MAMQIVQDKRDLTCKKLDCIYASRQSLICCNYLILEGKKRGCPADENCCRYKPGRYLGENKRSIKFGGVK